MHAVVVRSTCRNQNGKQWVQSTVGRSDDEKAHGVVVRSSFGSQNVQKTTQFRTTLGSWSWAAEKVYGVRSCGAKHVSKSKFEKHTTFGPLLKVQPHHTATRAKTTTTSYNYSYNCNYNYNYNYNYNCNCNYNCNYNCNDSYSYSYNYATTTTTNTTATTTTATTATITLQLQRQLQLQLNYATTTTTTTTTTARQYTTSSSCGWGDHCNHSKEQDSLWFALPSIHRNKSPLL